VGVYQRQNFRSSTSAKFNELKQRITTDIASVDKNMLRFVWTELDYRIDICLVTKGSHIEHL